MNALRIDDRPQSPSKVKRDLEQLKNALGRVGSDAQRLIDAAVGIYSEGILGSSYLERLEKAMQKIIDAMPDGRQPDPVRGTLGQQAAFLWRLHGGDLSDPLFVSFLELLIEDAKPGDERALNNIDIDSVSLARDIRKQHA